jgi:hypothetical protein
VKYGEKEDTEIDMDELYAAMDDSSYEHEYYLDLVTGEIQFLSEYMDDQETEKIREKIDDYPDRY